VNKRVRLIGVVLPVMALLAGACGSDKKAATTTVAATQAPTTTAAASTATTTGATEGTSAETTAETSADTIADTTEATTEATTAGTASETTTASSAGAPTGTPIKLMSIYVKNNPAFSQPETFTGAQARVDEINASGGINGHPVELIGCDSNLDPNQEQACIDQAISEKVSAIVSSSIFFTPLTALEDANIPFIGAQGITPDQLSSPMSYPFSGINGWFKGEVAIAVKAGAKKITIVTGDTASSQYAESIAMGAITAAGLTPNKSVVAAVGKTEFTAEAAAAIADNPDAVVLNGPAEVLTKFTLAMRQAGYTGLIVSFGSGVGGEAIESLGDDGNGVLVSLIAKPVSDSSDPMVAEFIKEMDATDSSASKDELAAYGWSSVYVFGEVMKDATAYDAAGTIDTFNNMTTPIDAGLFGPFQGSGTAVSPDTPRLFNLSYIEGEIKDGDLIANGDFEDPAKVLTGS
jgi:branched-chain amino acid transport system substrate-binding protein